MREVSLQAIGIMAGKTGGMNCPGLLSGLVRFEDGWATIQLQDGEEALFDAMVKDRIFPYGVGYLVARRTKIPGPPRVFEVLTTESKKAAQQPDDASFDEAHGWITYSEACQVVSRPKLNEAVAEGKVRQTVLPDGTKRYYKPDMAVLPC